MSETVKAFDTVLPVDEIVGVVVVAVVVVAVLVVEALVVVSVVTVTGAFTTTDSLAFAQLVLAPL